MTDHIYVGLSAGEFDEIESLFPKFECIDVATVNSDGESWHGMYISTRGQNYFEFLRDRRANKVGIAQRARNPMDQNVGHIVSDFPDLPWQKSSRSIRGQLWFDAYSCDDYMSLETLFNTWAMGYWQRDAGYVLPASKWEIDRISYVEVTANAEARASVFKNSAWLNANASRENDALELDLHTYYGDPLICRIKFVTQPEPFKLQELKFELHSEMEELTKESADFKLTIRGRELSLVRKA